MPVALIFDYDAEAGKAQVWSSHEPSSFVEDRDIDPGYGKAGLYYCDSEC